MFTEDMPKVVSGFFEMLDAVEQHFRERYAVERLSRQGEQALVFRDGAGNGLLYAGLRWDLWSRAFQPFWLAVRQDWGSSAVEAFGSRHPGRCFFHDGYSFCPLDPTVVAGPDSAGPLIALLESELAAAEFVYEQ